MNNKYTWLEQHKKKCYNGNRESTAGAPANVVARQHVLFEKYGGSNWMSLSGKLVLTHKIALCEEMCFVVFIW